MPVDAPNSSHLHPIMTAVMMLGGLLRVTGSGDSGQPRYGNSEAMQPLPKRLKLENPTAPSFPYHGMFYTMAPLNVQPSYAELPPLVQLSGSLVSYNSEMGVELLPKLLDGSTVANRMAYRRCRTSPKEMGRNMEEWSIELISKRIEDAPSAKEIDMNMEEENVELMSKLTEDSSNAKRWVRMWQKVFLVLQRWLSLVIKWWKLMLLAVIEKRILAS
ncbi:hypothetical protein PVK06_023168 [Gossypium arboreum]|uniref:Uncharacterized protein n=1 Tax=Gossypium arboreum TaxID=29729 RepID=A0ABR0PAQ6_GOSAR|nr:hypothetical protein PVK06_023168 [Gossypium arboreum]